LKKEKQLKITDELSKTLGIPKHQIEEWAMILEEHNLLTLKYPTIGEPLIMCKEPKNCGEKTDGG